MEHYRRRKSSYITERGRENEVEASTGKAKDVASKAIHVMKVRMLDNHGNQVDTYLNTPCQDIMC